MKRVTWFALAMLLAGCVIDTDNDSDEAPATSPPPPSTSPAAGTQPQTSDLRIEINLAGRRVNVFRGAQQIGSYPAAVGSEKWPTPTGEWAIGQVIFNPRWVPPPNEEWAEDEEIAEPGEPDNPLGIVQLVYDAPNSIHGTNEPESLGKAVSHGSVRVSNDVGVALAKLVMQAGGAAEDESVVQEALRNKNKRVEIRIPRPVPVRVTAGR
jgi:lipoprotein-anchoring transpeptidase ErfK/SrfK